MDEFEQGIENAEKKFENFSKKLQGAGKKISDVGSSLTKAVSVPLTGFGVAAGKAAMDFEDSMAKVSTIADTTVLPIEDIEKAIIALSNETGVASGEIAESVYNVISATGDTANAVNLVGDATKLATAGFSDSNSALSILTTAMNAYGLSADQASHISDSLIMTQNLGVTTVADLSTSMGKAIATASAYGVNLENLESAYVSLTKGGINTAESTTYLSSMFKELGDSGSTVGKIIQEKTGQSFGSLMNDGYSLADVLSILYDSTNQNSEAFINLWGSAEAGKASNAIVNQGLQEFNTNLQKITESAGATESAYEKMKTNSWELKKAFNELKNAVTELGNVLVPVIIPAFTSIVDKVTKVVQWFNNLDKETQKLILTIAGVAAAVGPVLIVIGKIITALSTIGGAVSSVVSLITGGITSIIGIGSKLMGGVKALFSLIMAHPVVAVVAAIIAAVVLLWQNCEAFRDAVSAIWDAIVGFFKAAAEGIKAAFDGVVEFFAGVWDGIQSIFQGVAEFFGGIFQSAAEIIQTAWSAIVEFFSGVWAGIQAVFSVVAEVLGGFFRAAWEAVQAAWNVAVDFFSGVWEGIQSVFSTVVEILGGFFKDAWEAVKAAWSTAKEFFSDLWSNIKEKAADAASNIQDKLKEAWETVKSAWEAAKTFFGDLWSSIKEKGSEAAGKVKDAFSKAWDSIKSAWDGAISFFGGIWDGIKGVFSDAWDTFKGIGGNIVNGIKDGISEAWDGLTSWVSGLFKGLVNGVKSMLGIHSPSRVFAGIGGNMALGLAEGWNDEYNGIKRKIENGLNFDTASVGINANYSGTARNGALEAIGRAEGFGNTVVNIYSPEAVDGVQAARVWKKETQKMAIAYV